MSILEIQMRRNMLIRSKYDYNHKIMDITKRIMDLQKYAVNVADGKVSFNEMCDVPYKLFGRQSIFQQYSHNSALQSANMQMGMMAPMMAMQMQGANPQQLAMYQQQMFMNLYKEARKNAAEEEKKLLNEQEKELVVEKEKLIAMRDACDAELKSLNEAAPRALEWLKSSYA